MQEREVDFLSYLAAEEGNLLVDMLSFRHEFELFTSLEKMYHYYRKNILLKSHNMIAALYFFVLFHLYFSFSCFLRRHYSEALASTRKAIDAAFTAYQIILHPDTSSEYFNGEKLFLHIKKHIKRELGKHPDSYPLAVELVKCHEKCSKFGSHADFKTLMMYDVQEEPIPGTKHGKLSLSLFPFPEEREEAQLQAYFLLTTFLEILRLFKSHFDEHLEDGKPSLNTQVERLKSELHRLEKESRSEMEGG